MTTKIKVLRYFGGQDEGIGGYLEALRIDKPNEFLFPVHVLHEMIQRRNIIDYDDAGRWILDQQRPIINEHRAAFYITEAELLKGHEMAWSLLNEIRGTVTLHETDNVLGLNISPEEFYRNRL